MLQIRETDVESKNTPAGRGEQKLSCIEAENTFDLGPVNHGRCYIILWDAAEQRYV